MLNNSNFNPHIYEGFKNESVKPHFWMSPQKWINIFETKSRKIKNVNTVTLHEAIEKLLRQVGRSMTTTEIAAELNKNKWYQKKDSSTIVPYQIHGRVKNYPNLFYREGSTVSLKGSGTIKKNASAEKPKQFIHINQISTKNMTSLEETLMNERNFKCAKDIDRLPPHLPGLYCIRIRDEHKLPKPFDNILSERGHNILYIGIASKNLYERFLGQELRAKGHGTFFRSIGAILGYKPPKGSLVEKKNKRNYKFSKADELKIIEWINENLIVNWVEFIGNCEALETNLIVKYQPLLNLAKNPIALQPLSDLRKECVEIANKN